MSEGAEETRGERGERVVRAAPVVSGVSGPELRAQVMGALERARAHEQAGRFGAARDQVGFAARLARGLGDGTSERRLRIRVWRTGAESMRALGRYGAAERVFRHVQRLAEEWFGPQDPAVGACLNGLGIVLRYTGRNAEADECYRRALRVFEQLGSQNRTASVLHNLAGLYFAEDRLDDAEAAVRRALEVRRQSAQVSAASVAEASDHLCLASILSQAGRPGAAEHVHEALRIYQESYGPEHVEVGYCLHVLGHIEATAGNRKQARELLTRALELKQRSLGADHPELLPTLLNLVGVCEGDTRDRWARAAVRIAVRLPATHPMRQRCAQLSATAPARDQY